jgi:hypothetical protein
MDGACVRQLEEYEKLVVMILDVQFDLTAYSLQTDVVEI